MLLATVGYFTVGRMSAPEILRRGSCNNAKTTRDALGVAA